ncbi:GTP-binding protein Rit2, partial [Eurytemora carolleeae]|uniref:GTP-binding protein Rit2 n=1 Tax=Eurytemora carolleeae TaxID=1294199 RepID=UPI000C77F250
TDYHDPTIEDAYQQRTVIDGQPCLLDILDTAGQVEFTAMREQYMRCGEGFIICYSITDRHSFDEAIEYRDLITKVRITEQVPVILVANKVDLETEQRVVSTEEGRSLANKFGCSFYETSAAHRQHVDDVFHTLVRDIRRNNEAPDLKGEEEDEDTTPRPRWRKLWNNLFRRIMRGRKSI